MTSSRSEQTESFRLAGMFHDPHSHSDSAPSLARGMASHTRSVKCILSHPHQQEMPEVSCSSGRRHHASVCSDALRPQQLTMGVHKDDEGSGIYFASERYQGSNLSQ